MLRPEGRCNRRGASAGTTSSSRIPRRAHSARERNRHLEQTSVPGGGGGGSPGGWVGWASEKNLPRAQPASIHSAPLGHYPKRRKLATVSASSRRTSAVTSRTAWSKS